MVESFSISRRIAAWIVGALAWCTGLLSIYSFTDLRFDFFYFGAYHARTPACHGVVDRDIYWLDYEQSFFGRIA